MQTTDLLDVFEIGRFFFHQQNDKTTGWNLSSFVKENSLQKITLIGENRLKNWDY